MYGEESQAFGGGVLQAVTRHGRAHSLVSTDACVFLHQPFTALAEISHHLAHVHKSVVVVFYVLPYGFFGSDMPQDNS